MVNDNDCVRAACLLLSMQVIALAVQTPRGDFVLACSISDIDNPLVRNLETLGAIWSGVCPLEAPILQSDETKDQRFSSSNIMVDVQQLLLTPCTYRHTHSNLVCIGQLLVARCSGRSSRRGMRESTRVHLVPYASFPKFFLHRENQAVLRPGMGGVPLHVFLCSLRRVR